MNEEKETPVPAKPVSPKDAIRLAMRTKRYDIPDSERREAGKSIAKKISGAPIDLLLRSQLICVYLSTKHEIPSRYFCRLAWGAAKDLCIPMWDSGIKQYRLSLITPQTRFITGKYGIREPAVRIDVPIWDVNAFILPGLAFDKHGGRLGYGGGYFDKMLSQAAQNTYRIGVGYDWQVLDTPLPLESHDQRLTWVVTDKRVVNCASGEESAPPTPIATFQEAAHHE